MTLQKSPGGGVTVTISGKDAVAEILELAAKHYRSGALLHPITIYPAPHLGHDVVRIGGFDYDLAITLPGIVPDPGEDFSEEQTPTDRPPK